MQDAEGGVSVLPRDLELAAQVRSLSERGELDTVVLATADFHGVLRGKFLPVPQFEKDLRSPATITDMVFVFDPCDGLPLKGPEDSWWPFGQEGFRELRMLPDPATFRLIPWADRTALLLCDFAEADGSPFESDPRRVLQRVVDRAADMGYTVQIGYELEFYLLAESAATLREKRWEGLDYRATNPSTWGIERGLTDSRLVRRLREGLESFGIPVECWTTEAGVGQHELNVPPTDALAAADRAVLHRFVVRSIAERENCLATFMARPPGQEFGSSLHLHQSLWSEGESAFHGPDRSDGITAICRSYVAGQLATLPELTCLLAPTVNSYKRLRPWTASGVDISWSLGNWSATVRAVCGSAGSTRVEHRTPGADANPYLAIAAVIAGGLHGIERGLEPPDPVTGPSYEMGHRRVPTTLSEAVAIFEQSEFVNEQFGEDFVRAYAQTRRAEIEAFCSVVTTWEAERYLEGT
jgi:glutamine synthetase